MQFTYYIKTERSDTINKILEKIKKPTILLAVVSEVVTILMLFDLKVDQNLVMTAVTSLSSILIMVGIMSDPYKKNDNNEHVLAYCPHCDKTTWHIMVDGKEICRECAYEFQNTKKVNLLENEDSKPISNSDNTNDIKIDDIKIDDIDIDI